MGVIKIAAAELTCAASCRQQLLRNAQAQITRAETPALGNAIYLIVRGERSIGAVEIVDP